MGSVFYCLICKNYNKDGKCLAFPFGIPLDILRGEADHSKPLPKQDNEIVFEPIKAEKAK